MKSVGVKTRLAEVVVMYIASKKPLLAVLCMKFSLMCSVYIIATRRRRLLKVDFLVCMKLHLF